MWVVPMVFLIGLVVGLIALSHWRAHRGPPDPRERERRWPLVTAILTVPFGPAILLHVDRRLPAVVPDHWQEGIWGLWRGSAGDTLYAFAAILLLVRASVPALGWYAAAVSRYPTTSRKLHGRRTAWLSATMFTLVASIATARIARGGVPAEAFTALGHLTPGPVAMSDVDATLAEHRIPGSRPQPAETILPRPPPPSPPELPRSRYSAGPGLELCWYACDPPEPPPVYLVGWDTLQQANDGNVLLMRTRDGKTEAMLVEDVSFEPIALDERDVWRLLRPPTWPLASAVAIAGVALAVRRRHLVSACLLAEATAITVFGYAMYLGM